MFRSGRRGAEESRGEERRGEEGDVVAGADADAERAAALLLRRERKVICGSLPPSAGEDGKCYCTVKIKRGKNPN